MMKRYVLCLFLVCLLIESAFVFADPSSRPNPDPAETIQYLLDFVVKSDCTFIRNDKEHTSQEAADHMRNKYEYFKEDIKTPEDFIRFAASKSMMSGKPYMVRTKEGKIILCQKWLTEALSKYRKAKGQINK